MISVTRKNARTGICLPREKPTRVDAWMFLETLREHSVTAIWQRLSSATFHQTTRRPKELESKFGGHALPTKRVPKLSTFSLMVIEGIDYFFLSILARCKTLKKTPLAAPWPQTCGDISAQCKCEDGMAKFMTDVGASAKFECTDDGRKHSTYRIWCDDDNDGEVGELELSAEGRVKCRGGVVRRAKGELKNFECAATPAPVKKKKNKFLG